MSYIIFKMNHLFPLPTSLLARFLVWGRLLKKTCKLTVFKIWFLSLFLGNLTLKKKKLLTNKVRALFPYCSFNPCFTTMWLLQSEPWDAWCRRPHLRKTQIWLCLIVTPTFPSESGKGEHTRKEKGISQQQQCQRSGKQGPRFVLLVRSGTKPSPERKRRKTLMCPRCKR